MSAELKRQLMAATSVPWAEYKRLYPALAARIEGRILKVMPLIIEELEKGGLYQQLLAATDDAVDKGNIIRAVGDVIVKILPLALAAF